MGRCGYLATLISLSIGAENSDLRNKKKTLTLWTRKWKWNKKSRVNKKHFTPYFEYKSFIERLKKGYDWYVLIVSKLLQMFFCFYHKVQIFQEGHKILNNFPRLNSKCQIKWEIVSNFCDLFRMSEL